MNQIDSFQQLQQEYQQAIDKYNQWYSRCRQSVEFYNQNKFKKDIQVKCMEPIINFINGKTKAQIFIHGPISSGKSTFINSLIGNCILPSKNIETTQTIVQIKPDQEYEEGKFKINDEDPYDVKQMYYRLDQINKQNQKQRSENENIRNDQLTNRFQSMVGYEKHPLIKNLIFIDKPGSDSQDQGKDEKVFKSLNQQYQANSPFINIYMTTPNNYNKQTTLDILEQFRINQYKKIEQQVEQQKQFTKQIQKLITNLDEQLYREEMDTENIFKQSFCLLVNQKDTLEFNGEKELKEKCKGYIVEPFFVSSLQELQWNVLQFNTNPHNLRILLQDQNFRNRCLNLFDDDSDIERLSVIDPMQWSDKDLQIIMGKKNQIIKELFRKVDTGFKYFVLQMMTKITKQTAYFLENTWKKYDLISKTYEYISDLEIISFIEKNNQNDFIKDKVKFQYDYDSMKEKVSLELTVTLKVFYPEIKRLTEHLLNSTLKSIKNISESKMKESINREFFDPLDEQLNLISEFNKSKIKFQLDFTVMQLKKFFPNQMNDERISNIIQSLKLCQENVNQSDQLQFEEFKNQIRAYIIIIIGIILGLGRVAAGIWAAEYAGFLAFTGIGAIIGGVGLLASGAYIYDKQKDLEKNKEIIKQKIDQMYKKFGEEQQLQILQYDQAIKIIFWKLETGFKITQEQ